MKLLDWIRPEPVTIVLTKYIPVPYSVPVIKTVVDPRMGLKQIEMIKKHIDMHKYKLGDTIESVAYRAGKQDIFEFITKEILGGRL